MTDDELPLSVYPDDPDYQYALDAFGSLRDIDDDELSHEAKERLHAAQSAVIRLLQLMDENGKR